MHRHANFVFRYRVQALEGLEVEMSMIHTVVIDDCQSIITDAGELFLCLFESEG